MVRKTKYVPLDMTQFQQKPVSILPKFYYTCPRCIQKYEGDYHDIKRKQITNCASSIRVSKDIPDTVRMMYSFDGPPSTHLIKIGDTYLQTFYGSRFDGRHYRFNIENSNKLSDLSKEYSWVQRDN